MASREELQLLRGARAGQTAAQLALGKRYLFDSVSLPTALHWLERAARQDCEEACLLIGEHIPVELAVQGSGIAPALLWYERAFDMGSPKAGIAFARLVMQSGEAADGLRDKAFHALEDAAQAGLADAQWLLAERAGHSKTNGNGETNTHEWAERAAGNGVPQAQIALAEQAWETGDRTTFMRWALPLARALASGKGAGTRALSRKDAHLLSRCAQVLFEDGGHDSDELVSLWTLAAAGGDEMATFRLGLWFARMDENGNRTNERQGAANFKKAIRWLTQAGEQGSADAHFVLSRIFQKPEFSQRDPKEAQRSLEQAADMGHARAQFECGAALWKQRRDEGNDVRAAYWLQKAAAQGNADAALLLNRIAPRPTPAPWALAAQEQLTRDVVNSQPFLAARIELAALFGLTRPEALLLDLHEADQGHCLLADIRKLYGRSKRRLVLIQSAQERQALSRITRLFDKVDCGLNGPEGNYRQRQYRLKTLLPAAYTDDPDEE